MSNKNSPPQNELVEQARLVKWSHKTTVRAVMPDLAWLHHSPNGGMRSSLTGAQMKALGTKAGFPDLILLAGNAQYTGLAIEMKTDKGRTSPQQEGWLAHLAAHRLSVHVCRSAEEARLTICHYFGLDPDHVPHLD